MTTPRFISPSTGYREPSETIARIKKILYFVAFVSLAVLWIEVIWGFVKAFS